ncbi:MAG: hypothetical protein C5B55_00510 [Blastocatellia bacterium]|nr:MAG: hypothetical protein C5B55_00510 [Blastocatellia bacterium]
MSPTRKSLLTLATVVIIGFCQMVVHADPLVLSLTNNSLTTVPGGSVTFFGSATNTGTTSTQTDTITGLTHPFNGPPGASTDDSLFIANFQNHTVANGNTLGPLAIFTVTFSTSVPAGSSYSGSVAFVYNGSINETFTNQVPFTIRIVAVPEPMTLVLLGTGLAAFAGARTNRRKTKVY